MIMFNVNVGDLMLDKLRLKYYGFLMCVGRIAGLVFRIFTYQYKKKIYIYIYTVFVQLPYKFTSASYMYDVYNILRSVIVIKKSTRFGKTKF